MRLLATITVTLFLCLSTAFAQNTDMVFKTRSGDTFFLLLHGSLQNTEPANYLKVVGVRGDARNVTVIFTNPQLGFANYNVPAYPGREIHFLIRGNGQGQRIIVPEAEFACNQLPPQPGQMIVDYVPRAPNMEDGIATLPPNQQPPLNQGHPVMNNNATVTAPNGMTVTIDVNTGQPITNGHTHTHQHTETTVITTDPAAAYQPVEPPPVYVSGYSGVVGCPMPMSDPEFANAHGSISSKTFENTKFTLAKQITGSNCLTVHQVRTIMSCFQFENTKLNFAKFAYQHTYDKGNYYMVNDDFTFDSSVRELTRYISQY